MKKESLGVESMGCIEFKKDCRVISLANEYPGYTGYEKYMILTDLPLKDLYSSYGKILNDFKPYMIETMRLYSPIFDYKRNENKHQKRRARNTVSLDTDEAGDKILPLLLAQDDNTSLADISDSSIGREVHNILETLTSTEKQRLIMWGIQGFSEEEIACHEGSSQQAVSKSLNNAIEKFKAAFDYESYLNTYLSKGRKKAINDDTRNYVIKGEE